MIPWSAFEFSMLPPSRQCTCNPVWSWPPTHILHRRRETKTKRNHLLNHGNHAHLVNIWICNFVARVSTRNMKFQNIQFEVPKLAFEPQAQGKKQCWVDTARYNTALINPLAVGAFRGWFFNRFLWFLLFGDLEKNMWSLLFHFYRLWVPETSMSVPFWFYFETSGPVWKLLKVL